MTDTLIHLHDVSRAYLRGDERISALTHTSLQVEPGEFLVVTGPSGSGKSTLLHVAGGLDAPDSGVVRFRGQDVYAWSSHERARYRRRQVGFVFQFFNLVPTLDAVQNVSLPLLLDGVQPAVADRRATELLERLGIGDRRGHTPGEMSGGQMQRVAVARAVVANPPLVLADEPTGNLDSASGVEVLALLKEAAKLNGAAVILVTHDPSAADLGDRKVTIHDGHLLAEVP